MSEISENAKVRLLGGALAEKPPAAAKLASLSQASAPPAAAPVTRSSTPTAVGAAPVFLSDSADGSDVLGIGDLVQPLARLCVTGQTQTPFLAAIAGPGGVGKSFALHRLARAVEGMNGSSGALPRIVVARVDAGNGTDAAVALAGAAYGALDRDPGGVDYSGLLEECAHAGRDPLRAAKAATDRHEEVAHKLEAARSERDEVGARGARLVDSLLFETPGSRVDVYSRSRRGAIEARLRRFDIAGADAASGYRDLVREVFGVGPAGRIGIGLRAIWAYPAQRRLLFWAVVAFVVGFGLKLLPGDAVLDAAPPAGATVVDWVRAHSSWFEAVSRALYGLGGLAILLNLWRAISFASLLFGGARLLAADVRDRQRDLESRSARLNQRVAALSADAEAAAKQAEAALRRAGGKVQTRAPGPEFLDASHDSARAARAFLNALDGRIGQGPDAPSRLVFVIDNIDALPVATAAGWVAAAHGALGPGTIGVMALDPARLVEGLGGADEARRRFDRWLQAVVTLPSAHDADGERLVARLLSAEAAPTSGAVDPKAATAVTEPLTASETALLTALAPLAARSPRDAKKFLNAYRLARASDAARPALALMLAVTLADDEARAGMTRALAASTGEVSDADGPEALARAIKSARASNGGSLSVADARAAQTIARRYALSL